MKGHKVIKVILSLLTIIFMLGFGNNKLTFSQESPRDVTDGTKIKITNLKITRTNEDTPVGGIYLRDSYEFKFNWDATAYGATLKQGDYFTVNLPESMSVVEEHANKELDIRDAQNNIVAKAVITPISTGGGTIKFTFTEFVNTHGNIKGNFNMGFRAVKEKVVVNQKNRIEITVGAKNYPIIEDGLYIRPAGTQNPNEIFGKWALGRVLTSMYPGGENLVIKDPEVLKTISKGATRWLLRINVKKADLHDVVVSDRLIGDELGDITMIPGSFAIFEGDTDEYGSAINIKNIRNISSDVQLAPDKRSFTYNLGHVDKKNYFLVYYTTYPPGSNLKVGNNATLRYDEGTPIYKESSFKESIAGGSAVGDNASKIKIIKFDADDGSIKLAKAKFELYNEDKQTPVQHDGQPVVLETGADGTAQSPQLISGTYYLKEVKAPEGYLLPKEAGIETENKGKDNFYKAVVTADGIQVFISNKSAKTSVKGTKTWEDGENQDGKRPDKIKVLLNKTVDGKTTKAGEKEVTKDNWSYEFTDLPKYEGGKEITYSIDEEAVTGYEKEIQGYNLVNKYTPEVISIRAVKNWDDGNNQDGKRPSEIKINLLADGEKVETKTVKADQSGKWEVSFTGKPKYKDGKEIKYTITEEAVNEYTTTVTDFNVVNKYVPKVVEFQVTKIWDDANNQDGKRPSTIQVQLYKSIEGSVETPLPDKILTLEEKGQNNPNKWTGIFTNLPKYENGKEVSYSVKEINVPEGYVSNVVGKEITNSHTPEEIVIEGTKVWNDNNNQDGKRSKIIRVQILNGEKVVDEIEVSEKTNWTFKSKSLPKYENGKEIKYAVKEMEVKTYSTDISKDDNGKYTITNTHESEKISLQGQKIWDDMNNIDQIRPVSITVKLYANGEDTGKTATVTENNGWRYEFSNLDKYKDGKLITYSVKEVNIPNGYEVEENGMNIINHHKPNKPKDPEPNKPKDPEPNKPKDPEPNKPKDPEPNKPKDPEPNKPKNPEPKTINPDKSRELDNNKKLPLTGSESGNSLLGLVLLGAGTSLVAYKRRKED